MDKKSRKEYQKEYQKKYNEKYKRVSVRFDDREYNYLKKIADKEGIKVASFVKVLALTQLGKAVYNPKETQSKLDELIFLIRNIANNLNQIARHSNTIKRVINENNVFSVIHNLETEVKEFVRKN